MESRYIDKQHNVSVWMYYLVCSAMYRRVVMNRHVDEVLRLACLEIESAGDCFLGKRFGPDHAHFLIQSVPTYSVTWIAATVKSVIARQVFEEATEVKTKLWGGEFWGRDK